jgi:hypothetical protein
MDDKEGTYSSNAALMDHKGPSMSPISSNDIELGNLLRLDECQNLVQIEAASTGSQKGASVMMNILHYFMSQNEWRQFRIVESFEASANAIHFAANAIQESQGIGDFSHDIVETWTESTASHNGRTHLRWIKMKVFPRSGSHVGRRADYSVLRTTDNICQDAFVRCNQFVVLCCHGRFEFIA